MHIKFKLKRKISGKRIKKAERNKRIHPTKTVEGLTWDYENDKPKSYYYEVPLPHENKGLYRRNHVQKRHVENPTIYKGEEHLKCSIRDIRVPSKKRKNAQKRFKKAFPQFTVDKDNKPRSILSDNERFKKEYPLKPKQKIKF